MSLGRLHIINVIYNEPRRTPLKSWISGSLLRKIIRKNSMGLKTHRNLNVLDSLNKYRSFAREGRLEVEDSRTNYFSKNFQ